jgi:cytochrome oxidase assembly protein ShyY1
VLSPSSGPAADAVWKRVRATGRYDADAQVLIRNRSVNSAAGYEVVTPLILADGTAVLIDRGWVPPASSGATKPPAVPAPPKGTVTVTARVRPSEEKLGTVDTVDGVRQARSVNVAELSKDLDSPVMRGYLTDDKPPKGLTAIPVEEERAWQNFAYSYQWWLFAIMIPIGLAMIARREAHPPDVDTPRQRKPRWGEERV